MFSHPRPYAKRIRLKQSWTLDPTAAAPAETLTAPERTEAELKAHAIN
jgi:hypothetical protein